MKQYYLAPMEGITGYVFRNAVHEYFGEGTVKYFTPFFGPDTKRSRSSREIRDIMPENNRGIYLVPQLLTARTEDYFAFEKDVKEFGYEEVNLNLGCPSGTVVSKGRGAGFLAYPEKVDRFLEEIFSKAECRISVKTRLGVSDPGEFPRLLEIYNKYPLEELIVHFRVKDEMYSGQAHKEMAGYVLSRSANPAVYNGDIQAGGADGELSGCERVMIGRGMVRDPSLIRTLSGGKKYTPGELKHFLKSLKEGYLEYNNQEIPALHKLKEIWSYMILEFPDRRKAGKKIFKAKTFYEYDDAVAEVLGKW